MGVISKYARFLWFSQMGNKCLQDKHNSSFKNIQVVLWLNNFSNVQKEQKLRINLNSRREWLWIITGKAIVSIQLELKKRNELFNLIWRFRNSLTFRLINYEIESEPSELSWASIRFNHISTKHIESKIKTLIEMFCF